MGDQAGPERAGSAGRPAGFPRLPMLGDEERVRRLEHRIRLLAENVPDMIYRYQYRPEPRFDYVSPASVTITGYTPEDHYADPGLIMEIVHPEDRERILSGLGQPEEDEGAFPVRWIRRDGTTVWTEQRHRLVRDDAGEVVAIEGIVRDVTEQVRFRQRLEYEARHDAVTGLANGRQLSETLESLIGTDGAHRHVAVVVVQVERFPTLADMLGRSASHALLRAVGDRLLGVLAARGQGAEGPTGSMVARGTAEQFLLLDAAPGGPEGARQLGREITAAFVDPVSVEGREVYLSLTIGGRLVDPDEVVPPERLLRDADEALRAARDKSARASVRWFDPHLHAGVTARVALENDLRRALRENQVTLAYQPQVDLRSGEVLGLEALARWDRPGHGPVPPGVFISVAEETGLIADLGDHVLAVACRQMARWRARGVLERARLAVNVSALQLDLPDLSESILEIAAGAGLPADALTVEVTESSVMHADVFGLAHLQALDAAGVRISIDDFGTGYSSLASIKTLPVREMKLDRTFVDGLGRDAGDSSICAAVVGLAASLGLDLVAEGVETRVQHDALVELGCRVGQGYLYSPPVTAEALPELVAGDLF